MDVITNEEGTAMKMFFASLILLISGAAQAVTVTPLATPAVVPHVYPARVNCLGLSFNADDSVNGTCESQTASASSGRGGHPTYTNLLYATTWDANGNVLTSTYCAKWVVNVPSVNQITYAPGFSAANCSEPIAGSTQVSLYDPAYGFDVWFSYESTSANGAYELVSQGIAGYVYGF